MILGERIAERLKAKGMTQNALARAVDVKQPTITRLINGGQYGSTKLHLIARELGTTPAYLSGEIDDPAEGAVPPAPAPQHQTVTMTVLLPSEAALARMFAGLLRPFELEREDDLARTLARQLPRGLQQLRGPLIEAPDDDHEIEGAEAPANDRRVQRRATRT